MRRHFVSKHVLLTAGLALLALLVAPPPASAGLFGMTEGDIMPDWWNERFEMHGFVTTKLYGRSPGLNVGKELEISSWRSELNLEMEFQIYTGDDFRLGLYSVVRPIYEAVYDINPARWGNDPRGGSFGTAPSFPFNQPFARNSGTGEDFPGKGSGINDEYYLTNSDTGQLFITGISDCGPSDLGGGLTPTTGGVATDICTTNHGKVPSLTIDDIVFFGRVTAPFAAVGRVQDKIGGNATGVTYRDYLRSPWRSTAAFATTGFSVAGTIAAAQNLEDSLTLMAGTMPLSTPLNFYARPGRGDRKSIDSAFADINKDQNELKFDCFDNAHPWCFVRELYFEGEFGDTFFRLGKQQIVWGKTDAFRLQDIVNPIDAGYHNVFPDLEERRIPQLALDVIHSFGDVGPLQDVSLEFAWVFDRFIGTQFGQCGEPYAFTASCEARADAGGHALFNFSTGNVDEVAWKFKNTEPGLRLEFRIPEPSIAFSLSIFWGHQDLPIAQSSNGASFDNPNCASMLFLQGLGLGSTIEGGVGGSAWTTGINCYDRDATGIGTVDGTLLDARDTLAAFWAAGPGGCAAFVTDTAIINCAAGAAALALPFSASESTLRYPRVLTLGFSMDYQFPGIDTILRLEMAADLDRKINNTAKSDWVDKSSVFSAAIGLDRPTYIPFLNRNRTAFLSFQTFIEHVVDYDNGIGRADGMVVPETQIITTLFMQNYWRNDSLILTSFAAYDWQGDAFIMGPSFRWVVNESFFIDVGINFLLGDQGDEHNLTDLCADHTLASCFGDVTMWNPGNWQVLNDFRRTAQAPWWGKQSFADKFMEDRDEFWIGFTYQF